VNSNRFWFVQNDLSNPSERIFSFSRGGASHGTWSRRTCPFWVLPFFVIYLFGVPNKALKKYHPPPSPLGGNFVVPLNKTPARVLRGYVLFSWILIHLLSCHCRIKRMTSWQSRQDEPPEQERWSYHSALDHSLCPVLSLFGQCGWISASFLSDATHLFVTSNFILS